MTTTTEDVTKHLPLNHSEFHILLALVDADRHGYGIMREVTDRTEGQIRLGPGTLYGAIKRMLEARFIEESDTRPDPELDDERRRYYRLTGLGKRVASAEVHRLAGIMGTAEARKLLGDFNTMIA